MKRLLIALIAVAGTASAVVWRHDVPAESAFVMVPRLKAVGAVEGGGVATLIAADWAITAAHVAQGIKVGSRIRWAGRDFAVKRVVIHPQGTPDPARPRTPPEVDLALVQLAERVPESIATGLMPNRVLDEVDSRVVIAGYGDFGPAGAPLAPADGKLRAVENAIADAGPLRLFLPFDAPPGGLILEGIGAAGDSGGPAISFREFFGVRVMGVSSGADGPPGQYGTVDVYTRVSSHIDWIEQVAGAFREVEVSKRVNPKFPREAVRHKVAGYAVIGALIRTDGVPVEIEVIDSQPAKVFGTAAAEAFKRWRFNPRLEAGVAVPRRMIQRVNFEKPR